MSLWPAIAIVRAEDLLEVPRLVETTAGKAAARHINRPAEGSDERKSIGMLQCQLDRAKPTHGDSNNRAAIAIVAHAKLPGNIRQQIFDDVSLFAALGPLPSLGFVRIAAFP